MKCDHYVILHKQTDVLESGQMFTLKFDFWEIFNSELVHFVQ